MDIQDYINDLRECLKRDLSWDLYNMIKGELNGALKVVELINSGYTAKGVK